MIYGTRAVTLPSEFIFDIDESLFETEGNEEIINIE
jgi:virulence-associated protein VagC